MHNRWAYRFVVVPLSFFMLVSGVDLFVCFSFLRVPITSPLPLIEGQVANRAFLGLMALVSAATGIGLLQKLRWAWYVLLVLLCAGVTLQFVGILDSRIQSQWGVAGCILRAALSGVIGGVIYFAARPVFRNSSP